MNLTVGTKIHGFTVTRTRTAPEQNATLVEMVHSATGAQLCWLDNGADNKLFSVAFKTLPEDSTGVFHILEHSVLCGSKKYPVREPFVELMKSSMQTFLNAITFPDKTVYPVSSRNRHDFLNLSSVYLDAVFAPRILQDPNIFYQEGWHIALEEGQPVYRGVVFNEMKGSMGNVRGIISQGISQLLFPDSCYRHNSGGDPANIPDLTYAQFVETYRRFYHPGNARFYLDGAVPLQEILALIDESLAGFGRRDDVPQLTMQAPVANHGAKSYELAPGEDPAGKTHLTMARILGTWADKRRGLAAQILCDALTDSNEAPLKQALLQTGLCQDVSLFVSDGIAQPWLQLDFRNIADGKADELRACVRTAAQRLLEQGLDHEALDAGINALEFSIRQPREPQGLMRCVSVLESWLYDGDPMQNLSWDADFAALRDMVQTGGFEALLQELLLDDAGWSVLEVVPSATLGEELRAAEAARLAKIQAAWSQQDYDACRELNEKLDKWQQTPDTPEQLATLPVLGLENISPEPMFADTVAETVNGVTVLRHQADCRGVVHLNLYFPLTDLTLEELTPIAFLHELLGELPTGRHTAAQLHHLIKAVFGELEFSVKVFAKPGNPDRCTPCLAACASVLEKNLPQAIELLTEILTGTDFGQPAAVRQLVLQANENVKMVGVMNGHRVGMLSAKAHTNAGNAAEAAVDGWVYAQWLHRFAAAFDSEFAAFAALAGRVAANAFGTHRLVLSITAAQPVDAAAVLAGFPAGTAAPADAPYTTNLPAAQGIRIPAQIGYAVKASRLPPDQTHTFGSLAVAAQVLWLEHLWNVIRVQGGAYGSGFKTERDGTVGVWSFRDPSPQRSLKVFDELGDALRAFCQSGATLDKYIISTVAKTEPLCTARQYGAKADENWFSGIDLAADRQMRQQILATDKAVLLAWADRLSALAGGVACMVAPEGMLAACDVNLEVTDW